MKSKQDQGNKVYFILIQSKKKKKKMTTMSRYLKSVTFMWLFSVGIFSAADISIDDSSDLTTVEYVLCNTYMTNLYDPFFKSLYEALGMIVDEAPETEGKIYNSIVTGNGMSAYAHGNCLPNISEDDCSVCLQAVTQDFYDYCDAAVGAQISTTSCYMRYENYSFF